MSELARFVAFLAILATLAVLPPACGTAEVDQLPSAEESPAPEFDPAMLSILPPGIGVDVLEKGRDLYTTCSVCHGAEARGTQLGPPLRGLEWIHINGELEEIEEIVRTGVESPVQYPVPMPAFGGGQFDEGELRAIAAYVRVLSRAPN